MVTINNPTYIRTHIKELEDETCRILTKVKPITITISKIDKELGCFIPIEIIDISEHVSYSSLESELFEVQIE
jgi:hypothetical protein